jgi:hypothetical protein
MVFGFAIPLTGTCSSASAITYSSTVGVFGVLGSSGHIKVSVSGGTASFAVSVNGVSYITLNTTSVGTIGSLGLFNLGAGTQDIQSLVTN